MRIATLEEMQAAPDEFVKITREQRSGFDALSTEEQLKLFSESMRGLEVPIELSHEWFKLSEVSRPLLRKIGVQC